MATSGLRRLPAAIAVIALVGAGLVGVAGSAAAEPGNGSGGGGSANVDNPNAGKKTEPAPTTGTDSGTGEGRGHIGIDICHATDDPANPYESIRVDFSSVDQAMTYLSSGEGNGHGRHGADIISAIVVDGYSFPGQNLNLLENGGCPKPVVETVAICSLDSESGIWSKAIVPARIPARAVLPAKIPAKVVLPARVAGGGGSQAPVAPIWLLGLMGLAAVGATVTARRLRTGSR